MARGTFQIAFVGCGACTGCLNTKNGSQNWRLPDGCLMSNWRPIFSASLKRMCCWFVSQCLRRRGFAASAEDYGNHKATQMPSLIVLFGDFHLN
ncbi:MAG: hypothetical protein U0894_14100 [Pirellulales bacterium]